MNSLLGIIAALLVIAAIVLADIKRAIDLRTHWERDEHKDGVP